MKNQINRKTKKGSDENPQVVRDYGNDPYFVRKANNSKAFLEKHGFPKELIDKKRLGV